MWEPMDSSTDPATRPNESLPITFALGRTPPLPITHHRCARPNSPIFPVGLWRYHLVRLIVVSTS